jgi:hypothetical protein
MYCVSLSSADFPVCETISINAFHSCSGLTSVSFPACTEISASAFAGCNNLGNVDFPACALIGSNAFDYCTKLETASFPACEKIMDGAFAYCFRLVSLYLPGSSVVSLLSGVGSVFPSTPITGYTNFAGREGSVYVSASLVDAYKTAMYWSDIASRIVPYEE